jgi:hypothetical protein
MYTTCIVPGNIERSRGKNEEEVERERERRGGRKGETHVSGASPWI